MQFERTLSLAKEGNEEAILEILEMYKPLLIKKAMIDGGFDEDLYQNLAEQVTICIKRFRIIDESPSK